MKLLPVLRLKWRPSQRWSFDLDLPAKLQLYRRFTPRLRGGLLAKVTGAHYQIGEEVAFGDERSTAGGSVKYSILNVGPAFGYSLFKGAYLTFNTGYSVYRKFEVFDSDQELLESSNFEPNLFFRVTIEYNVGD